MAKIRATVVNGLSEPNGIEGSTFEFGADYWLDFDIQINPLFVAVTDITDIPETARVGTALTLSGTVVPSNATNQTITWSITFAGTTGATINDDILTASAAGSVLVIATITDGKEPGTDYTKSVTITISASGGG